MKCPKCGNEEELTRTPNVIPLDPNRLDAIRTELIRQLEADAAFISRRLETKALNRSDIHVLEIDCMNLIRWLQFHELTKLPKLDKEDS